MREREEGMEVKKIKARHLTIILGAVPWYLWRG
jgi:hypothetical protein